MLRVFYRRSMPWDRDRHPEARARRQDVESGPMQTETRAQGSQIDGGCAEGVSACTEVSPCQEQAPLPARVRRPWRRAAGRWRAPRVCGGEARSARPARGRGGGEGGELDARGGTCAPPLSPRAPLPAAPAAGLRWARVSQRPTHTRRVLARGARVAEGRRLARAPGLP